MVDNDSKGGRRISLDALADLDRAELVERWVSIYGTQPPKGIKRGLLERAAAYQSQLRPGQRLQPMQKKELLRIAGGVAEPMVVKSSSDLTPGARLLREWNGITHQVDVTQAGFVWKGEIHKTLSAVAKAITGAHWSGPRFFGL